MAPSGSFIKLVTIFSRASFTVSLFNQDLMNSWTGLNSVELVESVMSYKDNSYDINWLDKSFCIFCFHCTLSDEYKDVGGSSVNGFRNEARFSDNNVNDEDPINSSKQRSRT